MAAVRSGAISMLRGRRHELAVMEGLLDAARAGRSGVLALLGQAGIGKTALLEGAIESASDFTLLSAVGVESEMQLASLPCISCARRYWTRSTGFPFRRAMLSRSHSGSRAGRRRIAFSSPLRPSALSRRRRRNGRCCASTTTRSGWTALGRRSWHSWRGRYSPNPLPSCSRKAVTRRGCLSVERLG